MPEVFIGAGSNADPERHLRRALAELEARFGALRCSGVVRGPAGGVPPAANINLVVATATERAVDSLRAELRAIEALAGRTRADPAICELDLDLLVYGWRVDATRRLPRPGLFTLPFVLAPLAEVAPDLVHPVTGERCAAAARAAGYQPTLRPPSTAMIWPVM
jgi:2-amino-4-hydroxy-6-hydroxymethyldihydropteridine diphosphokinase